MVGSVIYMIG